MSANKTSEQNNTSELTKLTNKIEKSVFPREGEEVTNGFIGNVKSTPELEKKNSETKLVDVKKWVEDSEFDSFDELSTVDSLKYSASVAESTVYTSSGSELSKDFRGLEINNEFQQGIIHKGDKTLISNSNEQQTIDVQQIDMIQQIFKGDNSVQSFGNIDVTNSSRVHIGNIIQITGPIHITNTHTGSGNVEIINQDTTNDRSFTQETHSNVNSNLNSNIKSNPSNESVDEIEREEVNKPEIFVGKIDQAIDGRVLKITNRMTWLAQPPLETEDLQEKPVPFVIISHTATEMTKTVAETVYLVRNIQTFHIESRNWHDIGYNFLVGCDGNVYEGRGWNRVGAHTYGYNKRGIGISFVGCFMNSLPPDISLSACKLLIKKGVEDGHIAHDYKLLAHCQCSAVESPGRRLFEEIKTWPHWYQIPTDASEKE